MHRYTRRVLRAFIVLGGTTLAAPSGAQPAPAQPTARANSLIDVYGTQNMTGLAAGARAALDGARRRFTAQGPAGVHSLQAMLADPFVTALEAQQQRVQAPTTLAGYLDYLTRDPLLQQIRELGGRVPAATPELLVLLAWNHIALDMTSIDHTSCKPAPPSPPGAPPDPCSAATAVFGEQFGPHRSSRAMAMVHLAMFEAANILDPRFHSYRGTGAATDLRTSILATYGPLPKPHAVSASAAVSTAAYRTLVGLYPRKSGLLLADATIINSLVLLIEGRGANPEARIQQGEELGAITADAVTRLRANDSSTPPPPCPAGSDGLINFCFEPVLDPLPPAILTSHFAWQPDPISNVGLELGKNWSIVTLFDAADNLITSGGIQIGATLLATPKPTDASFLQSLTADAYGPLIPNPHGMQPHGVAVPTAAPGPDHAARQTELNAYLFGAGHSPGVGCAHPAPQDAWCDDLAVAPQVHQSYGARDYGGAGSRVAGMLANQGMRFPSPTVRSSYKTAMAEFWGYDATNLLCAPPRLYNMIATSIFLSHAVAGKEVGTLVGAARYLAVVNLALADAGVQAWKGKFDFGVPRPVTYIRFHDKGDGTPVDPSWTPLGQTGSNGLPFNTTPPFPAWPSGHAVFGGAAFTAIAELLDLNKTTSASAFDFVSDEFNGRTVDGAGQLRPYMKVHYSSLAGAEWENAESRIWLGIHWQRDADDGIALGDAIGHNIASQVLTPCNGC